MASLLTRTRALSIHQTLPALPQNVMARIQVNTIVDLTCQSWKHSLWLDQCLKDLLPSRRMLPITATAGKASTRDMNDLGRHQRALT